MMEGEEGEEGDTWVICRVFKFSYRVNMKSAIIITETQTEILNETRKRSRNIN